MTPRSAANRVLLRPDGKAGFWLRELTVPLQRPPVREYADVVEYELITAPDPPEPVVFLHIQADALQDTIQQDLQRLRPRSKRGQQRMQMGERSQQNVMFGRCPRPRRPDTPSEYSLVC
jgi:hypothetical protein